MCIPAGFRAALAAALRARRRRDCAVRASDAKAQARGGARRPVRPARWPGMGAAHASGAPPCVPGLPLATPKRERAVAPL